MNPIFKEIDALQQEINSHRPLGESELKQIREYFRIGLTYSSNALEGNSLTETETKVVLEDGITIGGKPLKDHLEAIGHSDAYSFLYACANKNSFTQEDIKKFHHLFDYRINEQAAGHYRSQKVFISGSQYALPGPQELPDLMQSLVPRLNALRTTHHPIEFAALAHKEFVFIHPFIDGNGRVARLLMNLALLQSGYTLAIIPPIIRHEYIQALEKAHTDDSSFIMLIARMVKETQKDYLRLLR